LSQLALACDADISGKHPSFIETGRSSPSRDMVVRLAERLNVPLRERNLLLLAGGYGLAFPERLLAIRHSASPARPSTWCSPDTSPIRPSRSTGIGRWSPPTRFWHYCLPASSRRCCARGQRAALGPPSGRLGAATADALRRLADRG
jgi:transcriptional regulator with XRE-family HTH domain